MTRTEIKKLRAAVADYISSEGCNCCQNIDAHDAHRAALAKLLKVKSKGPWYDFSPYRTQDRDIE